MKFDSMISTFVETYDRTVMDYIDRMPSNFGANYKKHTIDLTRIGESCDTFSKWIKGYTQYCIEESNNGNELTPNSMDSVFDRFIHESTMLQVTPHLYKEIPTFVSGYVEGVNHIVDTINECKSSLLENDVDHTMIGRIDEYADKFADMLQESFNEGMDKLLWASGYRSHQILFGKEKLKQERAAVII